MLFVRSRAVRRATTVFVVLAPVLASVSAPAFASASPKSHASRIASPHMASPSNRSLPVPPAGVINGAVTDSATGRPLSGVEIGLSQQGRIVAVVTTDALGQYVISKVRPGNYTVEARLIGFRSLRRGVALSDTAGVHQDFQLPSVAAVLQSQEVHATAPVSLDVSTGNQHFKQDDYHGSPTLTTSQIIQQSIAGAVKAPTGEVHIRGQHAEYTYYVDGVPVPAGISGSLNELFDPSVVNQIDFVTGAWDAEYGNKNAAIVNVTTKIPAGGWHTTVSGYGGNYATNGQSISTSTNAGKWGVFLSGSRQETDMRQEPHLYDSTAGHVVNLYNHGLDQFGFGKIQYAPSTSDVFNLEGNVSSTKFEIPSDTAVVVDHDHQEDVNAFVNLGWTHQFGAEGEENAAGGTPSQLFMGLFYRNGRLKYTPGPDDPPSFQFGDDPTLYNLRENRQFDVYGLKADYTLKVQQGLQFKFGTLASYTTGREDFTTAQEDGTAGPASDADIRGHDIGVYAQTTYAPLQQIEFHLGVRYDTHEAPFAGTQSQVSPRVRVNFMPSTADNFYIYYGRQFLPTNVEDLYAITSLAQGGVPNGAIPTLPERDNFYEVGYIHRFAHGVVAKLDGYQKDSKPGIDDATIGNSRVLTSVNIGQVHIKGVETAIEVQPAGPLSGYLNVALNHAWGEGVVTGGFFPPDSSGGQFDLDHDQRLSSVLGVTYAPGAFYASATGTYGSGLTNDGDPNPATYGTGLFDFNRDIHVKPYTLLDLSAGYSLIVGSTVVRPEVYVDNVFNRQYALKGAFFSPALYGRPRTFQLRLSLSF